MIRLDIELVRRGLAGSRERAKEYIKNGMVIVDGKVTSKPSNEVSETSDISVVGETLAYVGRGGLKLEAALKEFDISMSGKVCLDIGASTGGFTDCMLKNGAAKIFAVDVGHDQLAEKLRNDTRVVNMEGMNVKDITREMFCERIDFLCSDLSFISVRYAVQAAARVLDIGAEAIFLIKPQFEAGRDNISKGGIVRDRKIHLQVLAETSEYIQKYGFTLAGLIPSPIKGGDGNIEYLAYAVKYNGLTANVIDLFTIVSSAFDRK